MSESVSLTYSCGSCGYHLNLTCDSSTTSSTPITTRKQSKPSKKNFKSFPSIDLSRFTQLDEINCFTIFRVPHNSKTKLLCRQCGVLLGYGHAQSTTSLCGLHSPSLPSSYKRYFINIQALISTEVSQNGSL